MAGLLADLTYGLRLLRKSPGFVLAAALTLALGIGATSAMFSVIDGVLLKPFPVQDQDRLLVVWTSLPEKGFEHWPLSHASFVGIRERLRTVSGVAAQPYSGTLPAVLRLEDGSAMPLQRTAVTGEWFQVVGARARAGRLLTDADDRTGAARVVVLSSRTAERLFGSIDRAIGRRLRLDEDTYTIVGVTAAGFDYPRTAEAWVAAVWFRDSPYVAWDLVVRVAPGFTREQVTADLTAALATLPPETGPLGPVTIKQAVHAQTLADHIIGDVRRPLLMLGAAVMLVLIVAGVNVASLLIARSIARRRELSLRAAVGATRLRLIRQLTTEAIVLACTGAILAVPVAILALRALLVVAPPELPRLANIAIDGRSLMFTTAVAMLAAVVFGTLPAVSSTAEPLAGALRRVDESDRRGRHWLRRILVVGQIAITMVVVSAAGFLVRSFDRLQRLDVGFHARDLFLAEVALPASRYPDPADAQRAMVHLAEHVSMQAGVMHATAVTTPPFAGTQGVDAHVFAEGETIADSASPIVNYEGVDASYFVTVGVPILRGRGIDSRDRAGSAPVVVVNQAFARLFWPGKEPIGRRIKWGSSDSKSPWLTVVGVAADTRYRDLAVARPAVYVPYAHGIPVSPGYVAVHAAVAASAVAAIRRAIADQEPDAAVVTVDPLPRLLTAPLARPRFQTTLAGCFSVLTVVLSVIGTYGLLSFLVRQRRREIGIRIALGATPSRVRGLVVREGLTLAVVGVLIGVALAPRVGLLIQPLLFEVSAVDPIVLIGTAGFLLAAAVGAMLFPTRLAARTDPVAVLRGD